LWGFVFGLQHEILDAHPMARKTYKQDIDLCLRLQTWIAKFCFKLKLGCITFPCLVPIAKLAYFGKKCHLCLRLHFVQ